MFYTKTQELFLSDSNSWSEIPELFLNSGDGIGMYFGKIHSFSKGRAV